MSVSDASHNAINSSSRLIITPLPALRDNYIWVIAQASTNYVYVVDPGDAQVVIDYLSVNKLKLAGILITHHHWDHTDGVAELVGHYGGNIEVFGPASENIAHITTPISTQTSVTLQRFNQVAQIMQIPAHTAGHIAYLLNDELFCGDTLFSGGCGRLFEGSAAQMHQSLSLLAQLPAETRVYCAHEYTLANLKFALTVDPDNLDLAAYWDVCQQKIAANLPTLPSNIGTERQINPFLRCETPEIARAICNHFKREATEPVAVFTLLRQWKDNF